MMLRKTLLLLLAGPVAGLYGALVTRAEDSLAPHDLTLWRDPAFRRQFLASYGVLAEVEPPLSAEEKQLMERIAALLGTERGIDAVRAYLERSIRPNQSALFDFTLGNILLQQARLGDAARWYYSATVKHPAFLRAHKNLGVLCVRTGGYERAIAPLSRAIELGARDGLTFGLLAYAYAMTEQHTAAESAYRMAMLLQPETSDWKLGLVRTLFHLRKFEEASALCEELLRAQPERHELRLLQANAFLGMKQNLRAAEIYELLDASGKAAAPLLNTLGDIYVNEGLPELAADAYVRALSDTSDSDTGRAIRNAEVLAARGAHDESALVLRALRARPEPPLAKEQQIRALKLDARMAMARRAADGEQARLLEEIVALDPLDGDALILLGQFYAGSSNQLERAYLTFERAAAMPACEGEAKLRHAQCLVRNGRYQEALPLLRRAQELNPREDVARYLEQVERAARSRG
jgi:tetratricopeptide (TPR) repeat protein